MNSYGVVMLLCCSGLAWGQGSQENYKAVRLDDIERDNLKSAQPPRSSPAGQSPGQYQSPLFYQQQYYPQQQLFAQPQVNPSQSSAYHQQLLFSQQQPVYIPQHQPLPFPIMLIPSPHYLLPQDISQYVGQSAKYSPASVQQIPSVQKPFRASPPLTYQSQFPQQAQQQQSFNPYQSVYPQKYTSGVKSTVAPPLKDNYVQQASTYTNYKPQ